MRCLLKATEATSLETLDQWAVWKCTEIKQKVLLEKEKTELVGSLIKAYEIVSPWNRTEKIKELLRTFDVEDGKKEEKKDNL